MHNVLTNKREAWQKYPTNVQNIKKTSLPHAMDKSEARLKYHMQDKKKKIRTVSYLYVTEYIPQMP